MPAPLLLTFVLRREIMKHTINQSSGSQSIDRKLLRLLRRNGAQTIDALTRQTGIEWGQVFLSVDRLSRTGKVSLTAVYPSEYRVSVHGAAHKAAN
jgi:DNA-binding Lrp family transcriptional regulator